MDRIEDPGAHNRIHAGLMGPAESRSWAAQARADAGRLDEAVADGAPAWMGGVAVRLRLLAAIVERDNSAEGSHG